MLKGKLHVGKSGGGYNSWIYDEDNFLVAQCKSRITETGNEAFAVEIVRRWNAIEELLAAIEGD